MDYNKIGNLIMTERKAKKLTQAKLAEKLFVSEKTISKWETGNGIPDTNILPKLCEIFGISINEILNGERLKKEDYENKAEKKLLELQKEKQEKDKRLLHIEIVLATVSIISFLLILFAAIYAIEELNMLALPIVVIVLDTIMFMTSMFYCLYIEQKAGYYYCKKCGHKYVPTFTQVNLAMHIFRTRYFKCPHCQKKSWHKKIIK